MDDDVSREIKEEFDCDNDLRCLDLDRDTICHIKSIIEKNMFFIRNRPSFECKAFNFGDSFVCRCPIRIELHRLFNI